MKKITSILLASLVLFGLVFIGCENGSDTGSGAVTVKVVDGENAVTIGTDFDAIKTVVKGYPSAGVGQCS